MSISKNVQWSAEGGFTLIELMAAMVVMAVGLFAVIQLQLVSIRGNSYAQERSGAQEIANGVAEELMTQSLQWIDKQTGVDVAFANVFKTPLTTISATIGPAVMGDPIAFGNLRALTKYRDNTIASNDASAASATLINTAGCSAVGCAGRAYRVNYIAQTVRVRQNDLQDDPNVVRITVFVSWDNKDLGAPTDPTDANWVTYFWDRHMVSVTFFVARSRLW